MGVSPCPFGCYPSERMLEVSRALDPECIHVPGDMRTVRLGRVFDAVFVHDAVDYMTAEADLRAVLETVATHLRPGGVALSAPDATRETFEPGTTLEGGDEPAGADGRSRSLRYMEWTLPLMPGATIVEVHYGMLLRERDGSVRSVHDMHQCVESRTIEGEAYDTFIACRATAKMSSVRAVRTNPT